jgi:hypothetical protein
MAGLLYPGELRDASEWVGQNAQCILDSVRRADGWSKVFPDKFPMWVHKLRNFFNVEPTTLRLLDKGITSYWMAKIREHGHLGGYTSGPRTLSGHVYVDEYNRVWYQMGPGGSIYHWGDDPSWHAPVDAIVTHFFRGQTGIPIFKLICPDGTDGSNETIVSNDMERREVVTPGSRSYEVKGQSRIGDVNQTVPVKGRLVTTMDHQGSYNFAETAVRGLDEHEKYDVNTHKKDKVYIDPRDRFTALSSRIFTEAVLRSAGANTKRTVRNMNDISLDFDEPPMRRSPYGVSK